MSLFSDRSYPQMNTDVTEESPVANFAGKEFAAKFLQAVEEARKK
jgi:hypothetical protein